MTRKKISDALGNIDERHINEVAGFSGKKKKAVWVRWVAAAACFALIVSAFGVILGIPPHNIVDLSAAQAAGAFSGYYGATGTTAYTAESYPESFFSLLTPVPKYKYLDIYLPVEKNTVTDTSTLDEFFYRIAPSLMEAFDVNDTSNADNYSDTFYSWAIHRQFDGSLSADFSQYNGSRYPYSGKIASEEVNLSGDSLKQLDGRPLEINMLDSNEKIISSLHWAENRLAKIFNIKVENITVYRYTDDNCDKINVNFLGKDKKTSLPARIHIKFSQNETGGNILSCEEISYVNERVPESDYYTLLGKAKKISLAQAEEMLQNGYVFGGHACEYCMSKQEEVVFDTYDYVGFEYFTGKNIRVPFYTFYKKISDTDEHGNTTYAKTYVCAVELSGLAEYFEAQKAYHK